LCIGQRVSDLLKLSPDNLRKAHIGLYIDIIQQKTKKPVTVGVADPLVIEILKNEFPRRVSQVVFNKQIKALCRMAGIDELVSGFKNNSKTRRKEVVSAPKNAFVTSHIMRRSFASNYYGKIETPLLMNITGHSKESTFLSYIGTHQNKDALVESSSGSNVTKSTNLKRGGGVLVRSFPQSACSLEIDIPKGLQKLLPVQFL
jgi:integrase